MRFAVICVLTLVVITALVCGINPQMHKRVVILDHKYKVVDTVEPAVVETKIVTQTPIVKTQEIKTQEVVKTVSQTKVTPVKTTTRVQTVKPTPVPAKTTVKQQPVQTPKVQTQTVTPKPVETKPVQPAKPVQTVLTPQQETVLWNKWRSDLQNSIMNAVNLPVLPNGTVFKFSFNVDKNGKITNIKCSSTNPKYNPYAIQYITPVIRSYQGKSILKFPNGSSRESTLFEGNIKVSNTSKYSTASDYNDIETVKH